MRADKKTNIEEEIEENQNYVWETLNQKQELFCEYYSSHKEFFGNWVQAYLEVFDIDRSKPNWYKTACVCASQLLSNPKVYIRVNELLEEQWLNDQFVDKQLLFLISQQEDKTNKLSAIKEYNKLKQRITDKIDHKVIIENVTIEI
jgi:hypothetical protein